MKVLAIGLGSIFENAHLPSLKNLGVTDITGVEPSLTRRDYWKKKDPTIKLSNNLFDVIDDGYDLAVVMTYPVGRSSILSWLYYAKIKIVVCEKPLATNDLELEEIKRLSSCINIIPCHTWLYSPLNTAIINMLDGPAKTVRIRVERMQPAVGVTGWRTDKSKSGGGILFDHGYHSLYLAKHWTGIKELKPTYMDAYTEDGIDYSCLALFSDSQSVIELSLTWLGNKRQTSYTLETDQGHLTISESAVLSKDGYHQKENQMLYEDLVFGSGYNTLIAESIEVNQAILDAYRLL